MTTKLLVGINYAWKNYGWDFGEPPHKDSGSLWGPRAAWQSEIEQRFAQFIDLGFFAVRWFLLGDGTTYGVDRQRPHPDPNRSGQWRFDECPRLSEQFLEDFESLLRVCDRAGLKLLPSLVDFHLCLPAIPIPGSAGVIKCGRGDIVVDPHKRKQFFERTLQPLLAVAARYPQVIYAFEVINEPEWCTRSPGLSTDLLNPNKTIPLADMRAFLSEGASLINRAGFLSTVGFAMHPTVRDWDSPGLGLTLHQFHYYAEPQPIPPHDFDARWPVIVGELATAPHRPWPELADSQAVEARLRHIESLGYPAAFLWSANRDEEHSADPPAVDFSPESCARIRSFGGPK